MDTIGIDLHKRESQLCTITTDGELLEARMATSPARFTQALGNRPPAHILPEPLTESEWVARHLEGLGHTVIVADPGFAPMYASRSRRVKTDKRDARALCEALRVGAYREIHRVSDARRHLRAQLAVRDALVRTRTRFIAIIKAAVRRDGLRLPSGEAVHTSAKLASLPLPPHVRPELAPLVAVWAPLGEQLAAVDAALIALADHAHDWSDHRARVCRGPRRRHAVCVFRPSRSPVSLQSDQPFRTKAIMDFGRWRSRGALGATGSVSG